MASSPNAHPSDGGGDGGGDVAAAGPPMASYVSVGWTPIDRAVDTAAAVTDGDTAAGDGGCPHYDDDDGAGEAAAADSAVGNAWAEAEPLRPLHRGGFETSTTASHRGRRIDHRRRVPAASETTQPPCGTL